ncbi:hypothetical protein FPZ43_18080 [Mucilaginibacter pallidiroseus]|uniref:Uncharacterized protein n=1 Tax=Mucilaginibacter pallidiroseus TaxID=2599295 RepID=A0A563TZJ9_9SPHI|nr:hypothetical protein [Mucilaginibacter pallidiroseus]TWR24805.1 hypothetical protein FPZ43_18080 [Mucilaginibacter pallidiroseus]
MNVKTCLIFLIVFVARHCMGQTPIGNVDKLAGQVNDYTRQFQAASIYIKTDKGIYENEEDYGLKRPF